jgi:pyruvate-ferredoxin/flavodoxin oxidoreductase
MKNAMDFLTYNESPAVFDTYTTCQPEHGIADDAGARHALLAVESRMYPVFVHDPRKGDTLAERFSLEGNPEIGQDWITTTLDYVDDDGNAQLMEIPLTVADFAVMEGRFKKHFKPVDGEAETVPIHEFIDLAIEERYGKVPFIWSTDKNNKLIKLTMTHAIVELTEERRRNWRMLEYLGGLHIDRMAESHHRELKDWMQKYEQSNSARENAIDSIARGMAELASASGAPSEPATQTLSLDAITAARTAVEVQAPAPATASPTAQAGGTLVEITDDDMPKCTNCKTCYQDCSELFEKTTIVVDGESKVVGRVIPGILDKIDITPELVQRASRVADDCDAEIVRFNPPA